MALPICDPATPCSERCWCRSSSWGGCPPRYLFSRSAHRYTARPVCMPLAHTADCGTDRCTVSGGSCGAGKGKGCQPPPPSGVCVCVCVCYLPRKFLIQLLPSLYSCSCVCSAVWIKLASVLVPCSALSPAHTSMWGRTGGSNLVWTADFLPPEALLTFQVLLQLCIRMIQGPPIRVHGLWFNRAFSHHA